MVRLLPKAGTTRLLTIKVVQGQSAYLEVGTPVLCVLLHVDLRWSLVRILDLLILNNILSLLNRLGYVGLTVVFNLSRLTKSTRLVKLLVFREAFLGANLFLKTELGISWWLFHLFLRVPIRTPIIIHRLQRLHLLHRAPEFVVLFLVAVGASDGLFNKFFLIWNFVYLIVGGCSRMLCPWLAGDLSLLLPFLVGIAYALSWCSCHGSLKLPLLEGDFSESLQCRWRRKHRRATLSLLVNFQFAVVVTILKRILPWAQRSLSCGSWIVVVWIVYCNFWLLNIHGLEGNVIVNCG